LATTSYDLIYDRFLSKITDYELAELISADLEVNLLKYLKGAIVDFKYCIINLSDRNDANKLFNIGLTESEQEIIAKFMVVHWVTPHILRLENIIQSVGNHDFQLYSPSAHLDKLTNLKKSLKEEAESDMIHYYYAT